MRTLVKWFDLRHLSDSFHSYKHTENFTTKCQNLNERMKNNNETKINERPKAPITKCYNKCTQITTKAAHSHTIRNEKTLVQTNSTCRQWNKMQKSDKKTQPEQSRAERDHAAQHRIFIINVCLVNICSLSQGFKALHVLSFSLSVWVCVCLL